MKKVLMTLAIISLSFTLFGQYKVIESSIKRVPEWIYSVEDGYLIVSATGNSIEQAKEAVLANVKKQITQSIASQIVSETNLFSSYLQSEDGFHKEQAVESAIMSRTAKLPFISEITLSKAEDYYWEKRHYKKEQRYEYFYVIKYPFSEFEMKMLVMEYEEHDKHLNAQLKEYEDGIENIVTIEDIAANITKINAFKDEFDTTDPRYKQVEGIITRYRQLYDNINIDAVQQKKGTITATLTLGSREISTSQRPNISSNCATEISYSYEGNTLVIRYNSENCYEDDENYIDIRYKLGTKYLKERVFIKNQVNISLTGLVVDDQTGEPVPFARITLIPSGKTATSGRNGLYVFNDLPDGTYNLMVTKRGYTSNEIETYARATTTTRVDIPLAASPITPYSPGGEVVPAASTVPVATAPVAAPAPTPAPSAKNPLNCVRNGLSAYFRFNGTTKSEISMIQGNPVNSPIYVSDSKDNTQSISFSSIDQSQLIFPKTMISFPLDNYSITFWIKGWSNGHLLSCANGINSYGSANEPMLYVENGKLCLMDADYGRFTHPDLDYDWHFIAVTVKEEGYSITAQLYIDGILVDSIKMQGSRGSEAVKLHLGGSSLFRSMNGFDMQIDNLRIYGSRAITEEEVAKIFMEEQ